MDVDAPLPQVLRNNGPALLVKAANRHTHRLAFALFGNVRVTFATFKAVCVGRGTEYTSMLDITAGEAFAQGRTEGAREKSDGLRHPSIECWMACKDVAPAVKSYSCEDRCKQSRSGSLAYLLSGRGALYIRCTSAPRPRKIPANSTCADIQCSDSRIRRAAQSARTCMFNRVP